MNKKYHVQANKITMIKKSVLFILFFLFFVLFIPTIIVILSTDNETDEVTKIDEQIETMTTGDEETIVPVMRTKTEKIEQVPLEQYVMHVVASEMPAEFELEALKAQALAARTYVINQLKNEQKNDEFALTDRVDDQVYYDQEELRERFGTDYAWKMEKISKAVTETASEILIYNDEPITPAFFSTSNGYTENSEDYWESELPYLRSVKSKWDEASPKFLSQQTFTREEIERKLNIPLKNMTMDEIEIKRTKSNRIQTITFGDKTLTGRDVREKLNLPSNDFTLEKRNDHFIFTTKGYGHGVGMSQYGANGMAKEGKSYIDIVKYYYQDVSIEKIEEI